MKEGVIPQLSNMVRYKEILDEIKSVSPSVSLLAVSKTKPFDAIMEAYEEGAREFGENRVQEIDDKLAVRPHDMRVYLIGHLQSNKVKKAVSLVDRIESVDSLRLLKLIEKECEKIDKKMEILLEVNSSGDENKSGFEDEEKLFEAAEYAYQSKYLKLMGLMTIGPLGGDRDKNIESFSYTKKLYDILKEKYGVSVLSMGMSGDWHEAIECGSTEVRIGSAIFGVRV